MSDPLPERPDLDQLRRRAKELRDAARAGDAVAAQRIARHHRSGSHGAVGLAAAQLVIARELGFSSWPALKAAIDAKAASRRRERTLLDAAIEGRLRQAAEIIRTDPRIAASSPRAAAVLGDAETMRGMLAADPAAAVAIDDERGWPPLLYACYSRWHQIDPGRAAGIAEVVRLLLDAGASPNTNDGGRRRYRSALRGAVEVNSPQITKLLLDAGAPVDPGQPVAEAAAHRDNRCLRLLLDRGARVAGTWALGSAVFNDNPGAVALLLGVLAASGGDAARAATDELPDAVVAASLPLVTALLDAGADPQATDPDGVSALRLAVRAGKNDVAARLRAAGASDDDTQVDRFIGACLNADRSTAERLLADDPDLRARLTDQDRAVIVDAASHASSETITTLLDLGFPHDARDDSGQQPLHNAAYHGNAAVVRVLLEAGADVDARDGRFDGTPLAFATVGSGEQSGRPGASGDWIETARLLLDAGADREGVWISAKPPSEQVMDLLLRYGVTPDEPDESDAPDESQEEYDADQRPSEHEREQQTGPEPPGSIGTGVMAEIARHIEAAYRDRDLDLFASLLDPEVHWTGVCKNRAQVLDWYRTQFTDEITAVVRSVEVDRDAVVLGLTVARTAEGARPAPPQELFQVFTVAAARIVDIRGYPDRSTALTRT